MSYYRIKDQYLDPEFQILNEKAILLNETS